MSESSPTNILLEVTSLSMRIARKYVAPYSHRFSPQKFTQEQLLTCLILRAYLKATYRGVIEVLEVSSDLRDRLGLKSLPHYSTLKKFADRSSVLEIVDAMLHELVQKFALDAEEAAIDSTGMETSSASAHFQSCSGKQRTKYVKLSVCVLAGSLIPSGLAVSWGPCNDKAEAAEVLAKAATSSQPKTLFADAGYDAEWVHRFCREDWQVDSVINPAVHRTDGGLNGMYRSEMTAETLKEKGYGRRWLVESYLSGLKRTTGNALSARSERSLFVEAAIRVLAYALRR
ncbi:transposase [Planctomicrobium sp. SH668]|uniref:transposase n=1 Tax=Planctomicrobium sp. SH668 TaxID=3448126 RepID=UPI003F5C63AA